MRHETHIQHSDSVPSFHFAYRPDIDGLRAVAVLSVLIFHAMPKVLQGGFIGVDIFFVISGFLISRIIIGNLETNTFSFSQFYMRRIKRIFPTLLCVLFFVFVFGWFTMLPTEYKQLGKHIAAGAGFVNNFVLWSESGYFDNQAAVKPLLHLWSLGIEEQFYIIWPVLLWAAWKKRFNFLTIILLISLFSFVLNIILTNSRPIAAFYSPQTRFWELLIGSGLAWCHFYKPLALNKLLAVIDRYLNKIVYVGASDEDGKTLANVTSFIGIGLIIISLFTISKNDGFPGWYAVMPTLGAAFLIASGSQAWVNRVLLSRSVMVWFGLISFPLYLWHWPILSFATILEGENFSIKARIVCVALSVVLAWLTYVLLEKPMRKDAYSKMKSMVLISLLLLFGYVGFNCYQRDGLGFRLGAFQKISKAQSEWDFPGRLLSVEKNGIQVYSQISGLKETTLFVGDSNLEQYYPRIEALIKMNPSTTNSALFMSEGGCLPIPNTISKPVQKCQNMMSESLKLALEDPNITRVVIAAQWYGYLLSTTQGAYYLKGDERLEIGLGSKGYDMAMSALFVLVETLLKHKKEVTLVLNIPVGAQLDPAYIAKRNWKNFPNVFEIRDGGVKLSEFESPFLKIKADLSNIAHQHHIKLIDPMQFLCENNVCPSISEDGEPRFKDSGHLRPSYVRNHVRYIDEAVSH